MPRSRVDVLLVTRGLAPSRSRAQSLVRAGKVQVDGRVIEKASDMIEDAAQIEVVGLDHSYVSRGGLKLEGALRDFAFDPRGLIVADIGASTGGFTDCVLQRGATRVFAVDVGHDQLHPSLREDPRVINLERTNARELTSETLPELVDLVLIDASFISLSKLLPHLVVIMKPHASAIALVKPQFEVGAQNVGKKGVVRDDALREQALRDVIAAAETIGLTARAHADCQIAGPEGNREIFVWLERV